MRKSDRQLSRDQRPRVGHGGRRKGAGRKPGPNPLTLHRSRPSLSSRHPCRVMLQVREGAPSLRAPAFVRAFEESLARAPDRAEFRVLRYALLPDQAHFIVKARDRHALGRGMKSLTKRMVWAMRSTFGWRSRLLADRYRLQILKTPRDVRTANRDVHSMSRRSAANRSGR